MCICTPSRRTPICPLCPKPVKPISWSTSKLILVRGLPGSGKSTLAKSIVGSTGIHVEADMYFHRNPTGTYQFDRTKLNAAHRFCQAETAVWLDKGKTVAVSNTFTTLKEMRPYFALAYDFGFIPVVIVAQNQFKNVHDVPDDVLERMKTRFQWDVSTLFQELSTENSYADLDGVIGT